MRLEQTARLALLSPRCSSLPAVTRRRHDHRHEHGRLRRRVAPPGDPRLERLRRRPRHDRLRHPGRRRPHDLPSRRDFRSSTDPVVIDGTTAARLRRNAAHRARQRTQPVSIGLRISAGGSTVRGLAINRFASRPQALHERRKRHRELLHRHRSHGQDRDFGDGRTAFYLQSSGGQPDRRPERRPRATSSPARTASASRPFTSDDTTIQSNRIGTDAPGAERARNGSGHFDHRLLATSRSWRHRRRAGQHHLGEYGDGDLRHRFRERPRSRAT